MVWVAEPHVGSLVEVHLRPIVDCPRMFLDAFCVLLLCPFPYAQNAFFSVTSQQHFHTVLHCTAVICRKYYFVRAGCGRV